MRPEKAQWPELIGQIHQSITRSLIQQLPQHNDNAISPIADAVLLDLIDQIGGIQVYFPRGEVVKRSIRNQQIYDDARHLSVPEIAKKHNLTDKHVWKILNRCQPPAPDQMPLF